MKVEIDKNKPLSPGDRIEMHFSSVGMVPLAAVQIALIEYRLKDAPGFRIRSHEFLGRQGLIFTIDIIKTNPVLITAAVIGGVIIGAGVIAWLTLDKIYQIAESPAGTLALGGLGSLAIVAAIVTVLAILPKGKK